ncbi:hypothetical protein U9M48_026469 [Paspalum notatum var. saurae]|uniref:Expansin-like EG45 domain-containing protein n=1 Tax=Paspalum notatum var. saurae TaxID=547442 RepID=A0AAQ3TUM3_PASNO
MAKAAAALLLVAALLGLVAASLADSGTATYYTTYTPSACYGYTDEGTMIAAASEALWNNGAACGQMYTVSCTGGTNATPNPCKSGSVTVKIVDLCPSPGCQATLDLSEQAFNIIGNLDAGKIEISYNLV